MEENNNNREFEKSSNEMLAPLIVLVFFTVTAIIFYKYNESISRENLINFILMSFMTYLLIYFRNVILKKSEYTSIIFIILFLFIYYFTF